jgi:hypothetical protein
VHHGGKGGNQDRSSLYRSGIKEVLKEFKESLASSKRYFWSRI